jgi:hypothetical protein
MVDVKRFAVGLVAVFAVGGVMASAAMGAGELPNVLIGSGFPASFSGTSGEGFVLTQNATFSCKTDSLTGRFMHETENEETVSLKGCKGQGIPCHNAGPEEINLTVLSLLVFIKKGSLLEVGVLFKPLATAKEEILTEFECTALLKSRWKGLVVCRIEPVNMDTTKLELLCQEGTTVGTPKWPTYEEFNITTKKYETHEAVLKAKFGGGAEESAAISSHEVITSTVLAEIMG